MRLFDLAPRWVTVDGRAIGVSFACPKCGPDGIDAEGVAACSHGRIAVALANPPDGAGRADGYDHYWARSGADLHDLTLSPSVNAVGHVHFWVINGQVEVVP